MHSASRNLQTAGAELARIQGQASTQKTITKPSDDPAGTAAALEIRAAIKANAQYTKNASDGNEWLTTVDSALTSVTKLLQRASELTIAGANDGSMSPTAKEAIAVELVSIRDSLLNAANTQYMGRSVFAGNSDAEAAFAADYSYTGGQGTVERRVSDNTSIRVDADGAAIFGTGTTSVFAKIDSIVTDLRGNVNVGPRITELDASRTAVLSGLATTGARQSTLIDAADSQLDAKVQLESQRADIEDVDLAQIVLELKMQENVYQASLAVTARALQPTLMDFLR